MIDKTSEGGRLNPRLLVYAALGAFIVFVPIAICPPDTSLFLKLILAPFLIIISVTLLISAAIGKNRRKVLPTLSVLAIYWTVSVVLLVYDGGGKNLHSIRTAARWLVWSRAYKGTVLAQPALANGALKHVEWDGWGFPGAGGTIVYLVFDPTDSLSAAAMSDQPGKFNGIPCEVPLVTRLESHWYTVRFYTDEYWGKRNALNCGSD